MRLLRAQYPEADLIYLIGEDLLYDLPTWYQPQTLVDEVSGIGVMRRPARRSICKPWKPPCPESVARFIFVEAPLLEISSSQVRQRIQQGRGISVIICCQMFIN